MQQHRLGSLFTFIFTMLFAIPSMAGTNLPSVGIEAGKPVLVYVLAGNGKSDGAFIEAAKKGAARAKQELDIAYSEVKLLSNANVSKELEEIAKRGTHHIIAVGYQNVMPVLSLAERYPNTNFTVIDGLVPPLFHNVQSIIFKDHEGSFLVGMIAALKSKSHRVGFVGGVDIPLIRNFANGFEQGVKYVSPKTQFTIDFIGSDPSSWGDTVRAESLAMSQYNDGVDVIFAAAGGAGLGVLKAADKTGKFAIGVDVNQNGLYPGHILTSMIKRVDVAVFETLRLAKAGEWSPGIKHLGIKETALDYAVDKNNQSLITPEMIEKVSAARERIANGTLDVKMYSPR